MEPSGTLTFKPGRTTIREMQGVVERLSIRPVGKDEKEKVRNVAGKVIMLVNPFDSFRIKPTRRFKIQQGFMCKVYRSIQLPFHLPLFQKGRWHFW